MASYVGQIEINNNQYPIGSTLYGICDSTIAAATAGKIVNNNGLQNFDTVAKGVTIHVEFPNGNTAANPTLKVGVIGPFEIIAPTVYWPAGAVIAFTLHDDGTNKKWIANSEISILDTSSATTTDHSLVTKGYVDSNAGGTVKTVQVQANAPLQSSQNTQQTNNLNTTISFQDQAPHTVLAGPVTGSNNAAPSFRAIDDSDIPNTIARLTNPAFNGIPTAPTASAGTNTSQIATTEFVSTAVGNVLGASQAMVFKGTIGNSPATVQNVPATGYFPGWTYRVVTAGTYVEEPCEVGDLIIAISLPDEEQTQINPAHWTVAQGNLDGTVVGAASSVNNHIAVFSGDSGKVIADSGLTIETSVPANAVFTDTHRPAFKTIQLSNANETDGLNLTGAPTSIAASSAEDEYGLLGGNKWIQVLGAAASSTGSAQIKIGHTIVSGLVDTGNTKTVISAAQTPTYGNTFNIPSITVDKAGHITTLTTNTVTLPSIVTSDISGTGTGTKFLRQDGWKVVSIDTNSKAKAVTAVTYTANSGDEGSVTTAEVEAGVLKISMGTKTTFPTLDVTNDTDFLTSASLNIANE